MTINFRVCPRLEAQASVISETFIHGHLGIHVGCLKISVQSGKRIAFGKLTLLLISLFRNNNTKNAEKWQWCEKWNSFSRIKNNSMCNSGSDVTSYRWHYYQCKKWQATQGPKIIRYPCYVICTLPRNHVAFCIYFQIPIFHFAFWI